MKLVPDSNGEDAELKEFNACHQKADGKFGRKGQCAGTADAGRHGPQMLNPPPPGPKFMGIRPGQPMTGDAFRPMPGPPSSGIGRQLVLFQDVWRRPPGADVLAVPESDPVTGSKTTPLTTGDPQGMKAQAGGINDMIVGYLVASDGTKMKVQFKPESGEATGVRQDVHNGNGAMSLAEREVAASEVDRILGTKLVPTHTLRTIDGQKGCVHEWVEDAEPAAFKFDARRLLKDDDLLKFAVLDGVIGNLDRHPKNWLVEHGTNRPIAIDHGYAFPAEGKTREHSLTRDTYVDAVEPYGASQLRSHPVAEFIDRSHRTRKMVGSPGLRSSLLKTLKSVSWDKLLAAHPFTDSEKRAFKARVKLVIDGLEQNNLPTRLNDIAGHGGGWDW